MNKTQFVEKYSRLEATFCPDFIREKKGDAAINELFEQQLSIDFDRISDTTFAEGNHRYCQKAYPESTPWMYKYRLLNCELGELLSSIRFVGGDLSEPAIFVLHKDFELKNADDIQALSSFLKEEYQSFQPKRIQWYAAENAPELIKQHDFVEGDMVYIAEFLENLNEEPLPENFEKVELRAAQNLDFYEKYAAAYNELLTEWADFKEMGRVESVESLQELLDAQQLFEVFVGNEWAGIIGANRGVDWFLDGLVIYEEFLLKPFRGKKMAAALQRHFIEKMAAQTNENELLYGTIHYRNLPSLRTAQKVGRQRLGTSVFAWI